jgi:hypothetical protein
MLQQPSSLKVQHYGRGDVQASNTSCYFILAHPLAGVRLPAGKGNKR